MNATLLAEHVSTLMMAGAGRRKNFVTYGDGWCAHLVREKFAAATGLPAILTADISNDFQSCVEQARGGLLIITSQFGQQGIEVLRQTIEASASDPAHSPDYLFIVNPIDWLSFCLNPENLPYMDRAYMFLPPSSN
jgi:hypothetical protein